MKSLKNFKFCLCPCSNLLSLPNRLGTSWASCSWASTVAYRYSDWVTWFALRFLFGLNWSDSPGIHRPTRYSHACGNTSVLLWASRLHSHQCVRNLCLSSSRHLREAIVHRRGKGQDQRVHEPVFWDHPDSADVAQNLLSSAMADSHRGLTRLACKRSCFSYSSAEGLARGLCLTAALPDGSSCNSAAWDLFCLACSGFRQSW